MTREGDPGDEEPPPPVRVRTHPGLCQGWGECHRWAPVVYPLDDEGRVDLHVLDVPHDHAEDAWWGATACPERAITVVGPPEAYWYDRLRRRHDRAADRRAVDPEARPEA